MYKMLTKSLEFSLWEKERIDFWYSFYHFQVVPLDSNPNSFIKIPYIARIL